MGVGAGATAEVTAMIEGLGSNTITIAPGLPNLSSTTTQFQALTTDAAGALADPEAAPDIAQVVPIVTTAQTVTWGSVSRTVTVTGTTPNYFEVTNSPVQFGTAFGEADQRLARRVAVLGSHLARDLFGKSDPVGQTVTVGSTPFTVFGVLSNKGAIAGLTANSGMFVPLARAERSLTPYGQLSSITVQATGPDTIDAAAAEAEAALAAALGVSPDEATFQVTTQLQLLDTVQRIGATLSTMLAAIAAISLVVGGIGVTNIMLVTVTERTREIGIRRALGAPRGLICTQFIVEATVISLSGGGLGIAAALALSQIEILGTRPLVTGATVALAAGVSVAVGIFFGAYPAIRASRLRPVDALRHD
jgi:putative ABC transport system permease protein